VADDRRTEWRGGAQLREIPGADERHEANPSLGRNLSGWQLADKLGKDRPVLFGPGSGPGVPEWAERARV